MVHKNMTYRLVCAGLALWLALVGCGIFNTASVGDLRSETSSVDLGAASTAGVQIHFVAGRLTVSGGASNLMDAAFQYNVDDWKPRVDYSVNGSQGALLVEHQSDDANIPVGGEVVNDWDIRLNGDVPLDLEIQTFAGESTLDLSALDLSSLRIEVGSGTTSLDLSGEWDHDVAATVTGGVGEISITLPAGMGVRVNMESAIVNVTAIGLTKDGDAYVNPAYGTSAYTLTLDLQAGVGSIELVVE
jgi:hypothetical protein